MGANARCFSLFALLISCVTVQVAARPVLAETGDGLCGAGTVLGKLWPRDVFLHLQRNACARDTPLQSQEYQVPMRVSMFSGDRSTAALHLWSFLDRISNGVLADGPRTNRVEALVTIFRIEQAELTLQNTFDMFVRDRYYSIVQMSQQNASLEHYRTLDLKQGTYNPDDAACIGVGSPRGLSKLERDVHLCFGKTSRGTKIYDMPPANDTLSRVNDLYRYFPSFETCGRARGFSGRLGRGVHYEWSLSQYGAVTMTPQQLVPYKIELWLSYHTHEESARVHRPEDITQGEISVRLYGDAGQSVDAAAAAAVTNVMERLGRSAWAEEQQCSVGWLVWVLASVAFATCCALCMYGVALALVTWYKYDRGDGGGLCRCRWPWRATAAHGSAIAEHPAESEMAIVVGGDRVQ